VCTQSARSVSIGSISTRKAQEEQLETFFARSEKRLLRSVHSRRKNSILHKDRFQGVHRYGI
jgi:hypothetical protein